MLTTPREEGTMQVLNDLTFTDPAGKVWPELRRADEALTTVTAVDARVPRR